jgi:two-component system, chemotaxis family, chemotaxis protein CheY
MDLGAKYGRDLRILVVDDHSLTRTMVRAILKGIGFEQVNQAEGGSTAVEHILNEEVDLVICDWNMPEGNGLELLQSVRSREQYKTLPFIMLTAEAYRENVAAAMKAGVTDYIIKPFTADTLTEKLSVVLKRCFPNGSARK